MVDSWSAATMFVAGVADERMRIEIEVTALLPAQQGDPSNGG